jgi:hypothetical protein
MWLLKGLNNSERKGSMQITYEITYIVVCNDDGLVSHELKKIREVVPRDEDDDEDEDN